MFVTLIRVRLYPDSRRVGPHSGENAPYQGFFNTQGSNLKSLVKGRAIRHSLVVLLNLITKKEEITNDIREMRSTRENRRD